MSDPDWSRVAALFQELADLPPAERAAVLARCPDAAVRAEVASLLEADAGDGPLDVPLSPLAVAGVGSGPVPDDDSAEGGRLGERLGPYVVRERIGAGGMGAVYRAERTDAAYDRAVAIKVIKRGMDTEAIVARFRRERDVLARLDHPYIARLVDGGTTADGLPFVVMDLVDGVRIDRACDERRLPIEARLRLFCKVCDAVQHAHQKLVVHRDLKPDNVFLTVVSGVPNVVKLLDFGVAKLLDVADNEKLTQTGMVMGTPAYMSPEHARGAGVDHRSDIYAVGCLMFEALTGRPPYVADNFNALLYQIQQGTPTSLESLRPDVSLTFVAVVDKALSRDLDARFQSARAMADVVIHWVTAVPASSRSVPESSPMTFAPTLKPAVPARSHAAQRRAKGR
jgi:serine/threonine protein kinase